MVAESQAAFQEQHDRHTGRPDDAIARLIRSDNQALAER